MSSYNDTDSLTSTLLTPTYVYKKSGIGGHGNYKRQTLSPVPSTVSLSSSPSPRTSGCFSTGIGGAGNCRSYEERASISKEEEFARRVSQEINAADKFYYGIGGRGNRVYVERSAEESVRDLARRYDCEGTAVASNADRMKSGIAALFGKGQ